jgi:hypothetical protein
VGEEERDRETGREGGRERERESTAFGDKLNIAEEFLFSLLQLGMNKKTHAKRNLTFPALPRVQL